VVLTGRTIGCTRGVWMADKTYDSKSGKCVSSCEARLVRRQASCEGSAQGKYLRRFNYGDSPSKCAQYAKKAGCNTYMFSTRYPVWGCRCCLNPSRARKHSLWNLYSPKGECGGTATTCSGMSDLYARSCPRWAKSYCNHGRWSGWMKKSCAKSCCSLSGGEEVHEASLDEASLLSEEEMQGNEDTPVDVASLQSEE